jgi:hypothetical protein
VRQVVIFAGRGHCVEPAIPARLHRRGPEHSISVVPIHAESKADADSDLTGFDYALVLEPPDTRSDEVSVQ